jgi:hypothetical protein
LSKDHSAFIFPFVGNGCDFEFGFFRNILGISRYAVKNRDKEKKKEPTHTLLFNQHYLVVIKFIYAFYEFIPFWKIVFPDDDIIDN